MKPLLALKVLLFTVLVPGTVAIYGPHRILGRGGLGRVLDVRGIALLAWSLLLVGAMLYALCAWGFAVRAGGTPAPIDPPKRLVIKGPYRYTRNPMYKAVVSVLVAEAVLTGSRVLAMYAGQVLAFFHLFVMVNEEPALRLQFGKEYEAYCRAVPRWWVRREPYQPEQGTT
jgi:protein-S-isoprenylcysteine O-methyltransferase Ste14